MCGLFEINVGFTDRLLLGTFTEKMLKQRTFVYHNTFKFICERLGMYLHRNNTRMRETILVENRITMSLQRLGTKNTLCTIGEVNGVAESTLLEIIRNFYRLVRVHLLGTFIQFPSPAWFRVLAQEFEAFYGIPHIIGAIDGSHIPILALIIKGEDYYYRKSFHLALLQGIVDTKCVFLDSEFKWAEVCTIGHCFN